MRLHRGKQCAAMIEAAQRFFKKISTSCLSAG
jgi:hypothetical protein